VFVFFEGGNPLQPRYFGSVPGIPTESPNGREGFNDPDEQYPDRTNESDFSRLARGETTGTAIEERQNNLRDSEPSPAYNAQYPHNNVLVTSSGITVEYDDTPGEERIHVYHPSKTYIEINKNGRLVIRNTDDKFELVDGEKVTNINSNNTEDISGDSNITIGKSKTENIGSDSTIETGGNTKNTSSGNSELNGTKVELNKDKGATFNIVSTGHVCAITGLPHPEGSSTCFCHK
jgi:hypothetical protein